MFDDDEVWRDAEDELELELLEAEMDFDTEVVDIDVAGDEVEEVDTRGTAWYIFNTLLPPQYSNLLSAQTTVHPPLMVDPVLVLPALMTLPQ